MVKLIDKYESIINSNRVEIEKLNEAIKLIKMKNSPNFDMKFRIKQYEKQIQRLNIESTSMFNFIVDLKDPKIKV